MSTAVSLPPGFQEKIREQVLGAMLDMIPKDNMDAMINEQVQRFFDSNTVLTLDKGKMKVKNPAYRPGDNDNYNYNKPTVEVDAWIVGSKISPFTHLIWGMVHEYVMAKLAVHFKEHGNLLQAEFDKWFTEHGADMVDKAHGNNFAAMINVIAGGMFQNIAKMGSVDAQMTILNTLRNATLNGAPMGGMMRDSNGRPI